MDAPRFGRPVRDGRLCGEPLDSRGKHALKCEVGPTRKARHDGQEELQEDSGDLLQCSLQDAKSGVEDARQVEHCINGLKNAHRQVVYLTFFEGLSYPEIAKVIEVPAGTVKTRMMHAKQQLLQCLSRIAQGL